jgi:7-cyano-7-deazaguanine reductase
MTKSDLSRLTQLGSIVTLPDNPAAPILERVLNSKNITKFLVRFIAPEFTSLCPMTSQPDFVHLVIDYFPDKWLVEQSL